MERIGNPWLGLASYEEKDEYRFKGRSKDVECVLTKLQQNDCLVCYAESGAGKSSLINAGLSPAMRRTGMFPIRIKFTTEEYEGKNIPLKNNTIDFDKLILDKILQSIEIYKQNVLEKYDFGEDFAINFEQIEQYNTNPEQSKDITSLWWKLRTETIRITFGEYDYIPVLIFDQFEEIFSATWTKEFFQWLEILMKDICPDSVSIDKEYYKEGHRIPNKKLFKLLLSLRSEYIGELDYWCGQITYIPQIQKNRYFLKSFTREQAIEVISTQDQNDETSKKLKEEADIIVDSILDASGKEKDDSDINEVPSVALSLVCHILYNEWGENETFSLNNYDLNELIYDFYRNQLNSIGISDNYRRVLETVLISSQKKRLRIPISDSRLFGIQQALNNLISQHILKCENINGEKYIELVHDCLAQAIYKKSREERKDIAETNHIKKNNGCLIKMFVVFTLVVCVFQILYVVLLLPKFKLDELYEGNHKEEIVRQEVELDNGDLYYTVNSKNMDIIVFPPTNDKFEGATTLSINIGEYKSHENVLYKNTQMYNYAKNAKTLVFGNIDSLSHFYFGDNVQKVVFLQPEKVETIKCENNRTQIYIPYKFRDYCMRMRAFDNLTIIEQNVFETITDRLWFYSNVCIDNIREVLGLYVLMTIVMFIAIYRWGKSVFSRKKRLILYVYTLMISSLLLILFIGYEFWHQSGYVAMYILMLIECVVIVKIINESKRYYKKGKNAKICLIYNSLDGKKTAINVKKILINRGIPESEIRLDLGLYRGREINYRRIQENIASSEHVIVIINKIGTEDVEDEMFYVTIKNMAKFNCLYHPVISGIKSDNKRNKLKKYKIGYWVKLQIFPEVYIDEKRGEEKLVKDLKSIVSPTMINLILNIVILWFLCFVFLYVCKLLLINL